MSSPLSVNSSRTSQTISIPSGLPMGYIPDNSPRNGQSSTPLPKQPSFQNSQTSTTSSRNPSSTLSSKTTDSDTDLSDGWIDGQSSDGQGDNEDGPAVGFPGRINIIEPPKSVPTPLFQIGSIVDLKWEYSKELLSPPKLITISLQLPKDQTFSKTPQTNVVDLATNISGSIKEYSWDTNSQTGSSFRSGKGYSILIYDSNIGLKRSDSPPPGRLLKFTLPFIFYISTYNQTNDGVFRNYNPNSTTKLHVPTALSFSIVFVASFLPVIFF
ncbi:hypothetical protein AYI68_g6154 [Smittium mucronatum]|uniref:DUF7137 domain-containing protein n=1 Tax=Smittium mucronatum TaxID=133383 RepID=A0A1R0GS87_9FUNG|nr:hypothetical protein AYI68_g6154 [Smittium mucronatum]